MSLSQEPGYPKSDEQGNSVTIGYIVGQDNLTGQALASDGNGSLIKGTLDEQPAMYQQVVVSRNKATKGSRQVNLKAGRKLVFQNTVGQLTQGTLGQAEIDRCNSSAGSSAPSPPPGPPEPEPEPPPSPPGGPNQPVPNPEEQESQPPPEGCSPESDCQWYNTSEAGATEGTGCPSGTTSRGFAQLPGGGFRVLCCGPDRPTGNGCPADPTTYGYQCINGNCELVPNGQFATAAECESGCTQEPTPEPAKRYTCAGTQCLEDPNGEYETLAACLDGCKDGTQTWNLPANRGSGPCVPVLGTGGQYATESACEIANGREPRPNGYRLTIREVNGAGGWADCNPTYTNVTRDVLRIISLSGQCCVGFLGSNDQGLYGSWVELNGLVQTNKFLTGACGGGITNCPPTTCGPNFDVIINIQPL